MSSEPGDLAEVPRPAEEAPSAVADPEHPLGAQALSDTSLDTPDKPLYDVKDVDVVETDTEAENTSPGTNEIAGDDNNPQIGFLPPDSIATPPSEPSPPPSTNDVTGHVVTIENRPENTTKPPSLPIKALDTSYPEGLEVSTPPPPHTFDTGSPFSSPPPRHDTTATATTSDSSTCRVLLNDVDALVSQLRATHVRGAAAQAVAHIPPHKPPTLTLANTTLPDPPPPGYALDPDFNPFTAPNHPPPHLLPSLIDTEAWSNGSRPRSSHPQSAAVARARQNDVIVTSDPTAASFAEGPSAVDLRDRIVQSTQREAELRAENEVHAFDLHVLRHERTVLTQRVALFDQRAKHLAQQLDETLAALDQERAKPAYHRVMELEPENCTLRLEKESLLVETQRMKQEAEERDNQLRMLKSELQAERERCADLHRALETAVAEGIAEREHGHDQAMRMVGDLRDQVVMLSSALEQSEASQRKLLEAPRREAERRIGGGTGNGYGNGGAAAILAERRLKGIEAALRALKPPAVSVVAPPVVAPVPAPHMPTPGTSVDNPPVHVGGPRPNQQLSHDVRFDFAVAEPSIMRQAPTPAPVVMPTPGTASKEEHIHVHVHQDGPTGPNASLDVSAAVGRESWEREREYERERERQREELFEREVERLREQEREMKRIFEQERERLLHGVPVASADPGRAATPSRDPSPPSQRGTHKIGLSREEWLAQSGSFTADELNTSYGGPAEGGGWGAGRGNAELAARKRSRRGAHEDHVAVPPNKVSVGDLAAARREYIHEVTRIKNLRRDEARAQMGG